MKGKIFNSQEVRAILAGTKTQFREVIRVQPTSPDQVFATTSCSTDKKLIGKHFFINFKDVGDKTKNFNCPYLVGQEIFVKESFFEVLNVDTIEKTGEIMYASTCNEEVGKIDWKGKQIFCKNGEPASPWRPSTNMKQEQSRLTLRVKEIKVEKENNLWVWVIDFELLHKK